MTAGIDSGISIKEIIEFVRSRREKIINSLKLTGGKAVMIKRIYRN
jgi:hypothetical protein